MTENDDRAGHVHKPGRSHIVKVLNAQGHRAHHTRGKHPPETGQQHDKQGDGALRGTRLLRHDSDDQEGGDHQQQVGAPHGDLFPPATKVGSRATDQGRNGGLDQGHRESDHEGLTRTLHGQGQYVLTGLGCAQRVTAARRS